MKIIVITLPHFIPQEGAYINRMFEEGVDLIHLRKPGAQIDSCRRLIETIDEKWHGRIVTHDHFSLFKEYKLHGIHLNSRNPIPPEGHTGSLSCSCHSLEEVVERKPDMDYLFLSPIFNSISKQGYESAFNDETLRKASTDGIIDNKVYALGGVTIGKLPQLEEYGFGGAALLGDAWTRILKPSCRTPLHKARGGQ